MQARGANEWPIAMHQAILPTPYPPPLPKPAIGDPHRLPHPVTLLFRKRSTTLLAKPHSSIQPGITPVVL